MKWSDVPGRHSLFWKLALLLVAFCLLMIWLSWSWGRYMEKQDQFLSPEARATLSRYAAEAEQAWLRGRHEGVDGFLQGLRKREKGWADVVGADLQSLGTQPLSEQQVERLTFLRNLDWPIHNKRLPGLRLPFPGDPAAGSLVMELPQRFMPGRNQLFWRVITNGVIPGLFTLLLCVGLYRMLIVPLNQLREQANAWRADQLSARLDSRTIARHDELGELARAFDQMAERLQGTVAMQQQLLRDLSHEMRTPLSRLRVACDGETDLQRLRDRLIREVDCMQHLVEDTLQLAWQDAERAPMNLEPIEVHALWELLAENACYESGWSPAQLRCEVPADCWVQGNLNHLAQALENMLRNAIRHSPAEGVVRLGGQREGGYWWLWLEDEGGGVAEEDLERIFAPFQRLHGRQEYDGTGIGLAIVRRIVERHRGSIRAEGRPGEGASFIIRLPARQPAGTAGLAVPLAET